MTHHGTTRTHGSRLSRRIFWRFLALLIVVVTTVTWLRAGTESLAPLAALEAFARPPEALTPAVQSTAPARTESYPQPFSIEQGETLGNALDTIGLPTSQHASLVAALAEHVDVRRIRPGSAGLAYHDDQQRLVSLRMRTTSGWIEAKRQGPIASDVQAKDWQTEFRPFTRTVRTRSAHGELEASMEQAVRAANAPVDVAYKMAHVLRWDLDFTRDLRVGDRFYVLYEEVLLDGASSGPGDVLGLVYETRGRRYEAFRFEDGYYDGDGRPLQKMFLRSPLPFSRITSRFSRSRFHPVLKVNRPHWGVDYGAPTGTPVRATASGEVVFAGRKGGAGNMVEVRHVAGYRSMYLHLSRFNRSARRGNRVAQGDVIGYVGSTGLSTGPHLDYRVKKDGRWIDPLSIHRTPSEPIPVRRLPSFEAERDTFLAALGLDQPSSREQRQVVAGRAVAALSAPTTAGNR